jgi:hypothetical protein
VAFFGRGGEKADRLQILRGARTHGTSPARSVYVLRQMHPSSPPRDPADHAAEFLPRSWPLQVRAFTHT